MQIVRDESDLLDQFEIVVDHDAGPADTLAALAEFLIASIETGQQSNQINTIASGSTSTPAIETNTRSIERLDHGI